MIFTYYPHPVALQIFGFPIRWYSIAYILGFLVTLYYSPYIAKKIPNAKLSKSDIDDYFLYGVLGVIIGGRFGYILFYNYHYYLQNPLNMFALWHGGMSFHGGAIGFMFAIILFSFKRKINPFMLSDIMLISVPVGLMFGRIANFLNSELVGRPTEIQNYGVVFTNIDNQLRHPSQLYEAFTEGFLILIIMQIFLYLFIKYNKNSQKLGWGFLTSIFLFCYAIARTVCEFFRMPDKQIGFLTDSGVTMGQVLNIPIVTFAIFALIISVKKIQIFNQD